jgi:bacillithiol system protein YtxJ
MKLVLFILVFFCLAMNWFSRDINKDWVHLSEVEQLNELITESSSIPIVIYKHSSRCGLSFMTENKLEEGWEMLQPKVRLYFLDLIRYREISTAVAERFNVRHQSPQILIIKNGNCVYNTSHHEINVNTILNNL